MRLQDAFYFFGSPDSKVQESAVTTLVTYRTRKFVPIITYGSRGVKEAMQKLYVKRIRQGTLHRDGSVTAA